MYKVNVRVSTTNASSELLIQNSPAKLKNPHERSIKQEISYFLLKTLLFTWAWSCQGDGTVSTLSVPPAWKMPAGRVPAAPVQSKQQQKLCTKTLQSLPACKQSRLSDHSLHFSWPNKSGDTRGEISSAACNGFNLRMPRTAKHSSMSHSLQGLLLQ